MSESTAVANVEKSIDALKSSVKSALKPGAYSGVRFEEYVSWKAVNWHTIEPGRKSAKHMRHAMIMPHDANAGMLKGGALDCMIFDGERKFHETYATLPSFEGHPNSNAYKNAKAQWQTEHSSYVHLSEWEISCVVGMYKSLRSHSLAWALLTSGRGRSQLSIAWNDEKTGLLCKGRIDRLALIDSAVLSPNAALHAKTLCLIDLKSTRSPGVERNEFPNEVAKYGYHGQLAMYVDGCKSLEPAEIVPLIVSVENEPPFDVVVHRLDAENADGKTSLDHGRALYRRLLDSYLTGTKDDVWPGSCSVINPLTLPAWAQEYLEGT